MTEKKINLDRVVEALEKSFPDGIIIFQADMERQLIPSDNEREIVIHLLNLEDDKIEESNVILNNIYEQFVYSEEGQGRFYVEIYTWTSSMCQRIPEFAQIIRAHQKAANASLHA